MPHNDSKTPLESEALSRWQKSLAEHKPVTHTHSVQQAAHNPFHEAVEAKIIADLHAQGLTGLSLRTIAFTWGDTNPYDLYVGVSGIEEQVKIAKRHFHNVVTSHLDRVGSFWANTGPTPPLSTYTNLQLHADNKDDLAAAIGVDLKQLAPRRR